MNLLRGLGAKGRDRFDDALAVLGALCIAGSWLYAVWRVGHG